MKKRKTTQFGRIVTTLFFGTIVSYFGFHVMSGDRGVLAMIRLSQKVQEAKQELADTKKNREYVEHRVSLLSPSSLDLDMLDEQSRRILGYVHPKEKIHHRPK